MASPTHSSEAVPLAPDRTYELPGGGHLGHAAALNVPCSEGHASFSPLDRDTDETALMQAEPTIEPHRQMEAGTEYDDESWHRLAPLFAPMKSASDP